MTSLLLLTTTWFLWSADAPQKPVSAGPAAMVLKVKGEVTSQGKGAKRRVDPGDFLLPGETVSAGSDAEALLIFLLPGERRRLKPGSRATLTRDGCEPADAAEMVAGEAKLSRKNLTKVREVEVREG